MLYPKLFTDFEKVRWDMERDIRRNSGYATVMVRRIDPRISFSWLTRLGKAAIPAFFLGRLLMSWAMFVRLRKYYDIPLSALPYGLALAARLHWMEIPGMQLAFSGNGITETAYR